MDKLYRAIFFWILVLVFIVTAPAIVLYAKGYRFDFNRGIFVYSGTISIKSNPQDIKISLNGKENDAKALNRVNNSYNISGLLPDTYNLTVSADGYQTWSKAVEVHSGQASEFWNVFLARNNYSRTEYPTPGIEKLFISPKSKYIVYTQKSSENLTVNILDIQNKEISDTFTFPGWEFITDERKENIEWSPNEDYISIPVKKTVTAEKTNQKFTSALSQKITLHNYFILEPNTKKSVNLNDLLNNQAINYVRWDPKDKNYLFYLSNNILYRTNINNIADTNQIAIDVSSFDLSKTNVYYSVMPHELVYKTNLDGSGIPIQLTSDFPEDITQNFRLIAYDDARIAFLTTTKDLFIFNASGLGTYSRKLGANIEGIQFSDDGKKLLYWTKNAMSVYYLRNWNVAPIRSENTFEDITRYSDEIRNIQWFKDYEHIIFSIGSQIKIIELDHLDHRNSMDLTKTASNTPLISYNLAQERLYFIDSIINNDSSATSLYSIILPEPMPILGIYTPTNE